MKIWKQLNRRTKKYEWRARFRANKIQYRIKEDSKEDLEDKITEIKKQEKDEREAKKYGWKTKAENQHIPTVLELLEEVLPTVPKKHQRVFSERVFNIFLSLIPAMLKVNELSKSHFQIYLNYRRGQIGKQSKQTIKIQTAYKEMYCITSALKKGQSNYDSLENWTAPELPKTKGFNRKEKRERLVTEKELSAIIGELVKPPVGKQTHAHYFSRVRLAHSLEFGLATGLRRKEIARLKFQQYDNEQQALLNVRRWKTDTITKFFPLGKRAIEIINERRPLQKDCEYIFTPDGEPIESNYRTLIKICRDLGLAYGKYVDGGFIVHDLRHNFGTEILRESDIETA